MTDSGYQTGTKPPEPSDVGKHPDPKEVEVWQALLTYLKSSTQGRSGQSETILEPGYLSTLSLFSELRFALGTPYNGAAPQQQVTSTVQKVNGVFKIVYAKDIVPTEADRYQLVYSVGIPNPDKDITRAVDGTVTIQLDASPDPLTLIAVKIKKQTEVLLVSFVTQPAPQA
jgi:hypothetical protein